MTGNHLSDRELDLLSAFLDGALDDPERQDLEDRLARDVRLRLALDELRTTVMLLRDLPDLKAPRSFALDPAEYGRQPAWWQRLFASGTMLQLSGLLGTAASVVLIVAAVLLNASDTQDNRAFQSETESPAAAIGMMTSPTPLSQTPAESRLLPTTTAAIATPLALESAELAQDEEEAPVPESGLEVGAMGEPADAALAPAPEGGLFSGDDSAPLSAPQSIPPGENAAKETATDGGANEEQAADAILQSGPADQPASPPVVAEMPAMELTQPVTPPAPAPTATVQSTVPSPAEAIEVEPSGDASEAPAASDQDSVRDAGQDYTWLASVGLGLLVISLAVFIFGRKKVRAV